ncbi:MAG: LegC family aminotransferase [Legionellaceae bacterium]|nr:LegC family aminotransferase [Legionellaceae bacterium]
MIMFQSLVKFIRDQYGTDDFISLHAPIFQGNERQYVLDAIDSTFVSSVGSYVDRFEHEVAAYTGSPAAVVTVNGTSALHMALLLAGVGKEDYVITQPLTFVATCNAISYCGAEPIFIDVDCKNLGLSPVALSEWLDEHAFIDDVGCCRYKQNLRTIKACVPMHTFGHPADLNGLLEVCSRWHLTLIEDAAESLGSLYHGQHTGTFGKIGILSFNGNKIMTTGGGGMILTDIALAKKAKHLTTTAKIPHSYEFVHDEIGFNYRMPNLNAAMGCAQLEQLEFFVKTKRRLAADYEQFFKSSSMQFVKEPENCRSNYWLNAVICEDKRQRDALLTFCNDSNVMMRPIWQLMNGLSMFRDVPTGSLPNAQWLSERIVNLPSTVIGDGDKNA